MRDGAIGEFATADDAVVAARALREKGFPRLHAFTPFPVNELEPLLGLSRSRVPFAAFVMGGVGAVSAYLIMWFCNAYDYPLDVGGRPLDSLPADIPIVFETMVLLAGVTAFVLVFARAGLPRLHHWTSEVAGFESATRDRFWVGVESSAADVGAVVAQLRQLGARTVRTFREGREGAREAPDTNGVTR